jgi:hypothetical protein
VNWVRGGIGGSSDGTCGGSGGTVRVNCAGGTTGDSGGTARPNWRCGAAGGSGGTARPNWRCGTTGSGVTGAANRSGGSGGTVRPNWPDGITGSGVTGAANRSGGSGGAVGTNWAGGTGLAIGGNRDSGGPNREAGVAGEGGAADGHGAWFGDASSPEAVPAGCCVPTWKPHQSQYSRGAALPQRGQDTAAPGRGAWCRPAGRAWPEAGLASMRVPQTSQKSLLADS